VSGAGDVAASLELVGLGRRFGEQMAVRDVSLKVAPGEMIALLGPSGCGKTTTLRMIAGFLDASAGDIRVNGVSVLTQPPHRRQMGIVFQSYALFPHLTVAGNVAFGLEMQRMPARAIGERVAEMLRLVKLEALADRLPRALSGGQQQRVALARALAIHPRLLLLDEPLSNLDASLRADMAREIRLLQQSHGITTIMVTHDQDEAMAMADRLVVMHDGQVQQIDRQEDLYERPANPFVARFIGRSNLLAGRLEGGVLALACGAAVMLAGRYGAAGPAQLAVRPETIRLRAASGSPQAGSRVAGRVELCTYLGAVVEHVVRIGPDATVLLRSHGIGAAAAARHAAGTAVELLWNPADECVFGADDRPVAAMTVDEDPIPATPRGHHHA
jgi:putative spermidine/putrescine transport system ATP-binding protein